MANVVTCADVEDASAGQSAHPDPSNQVLDGSTFSSYVT